MTTPKEKLLEFCDTAGSVLWFLMDGFWIWGFARLAAVIAIPTLLVNLLALRFTERASGIRAVTAAMNAWLFMDTLWMVGDTQGIPPFVTAGRLTFLAGIVFLIAALKKSGWQKETVLEVFSRFRRLRIRV